MKKLLAIFSFVIGTLLVINGCKKVDPLTTYNDGKAVSLTASKTAVVPTPADSLNKILAFSWSSPEYSTDPKNYKFIIEIDSTTRNFTKSVKREVIAKMTDSITGKE